MSEHEATAEPVWGAKAIGGVIKRNRRQTFWLLQNGKLPARKVGALWVSERNALLAFLTSDAGTSMAA